MRLMRSARAALAVAGFGAYSRRTAAKIGGLLAIMAGALAAGTTGPQADELDGWCAQVEKASSVVICSDPELRQEVIIRNKLFEAARLKLTPEAYKALNDDQSRWIKYYTVRCGVSIDDPVPSLPIPQHVIDCYRQASRARTAYLETLLSNPSPPGSEPEQTSPRERVPMEPYGGTFVVPVRINGVITLSAIVDSGAADVQLPADVVLTIWRARTIAPSDFIGNRGYVFADGSTIRSPRFVLHELQVGNQVVRNVVARIGDVKGDLLLGQSFLSRFTSYVVDNDRHELRLGAQRSASPSPGQAYAPPPIPNSGSSDDPDNAPVTSKVFDEGLSDRRAMERWYAGLSGEYREGAEWWAEHRSDQRRRSCYNAEESRLGDWTAGCLAAQERLGPSDIRRRTDPDYREGWNSYY